MAEGRVVDSRTAAWFLTSPPGARVGLKERPRVTALIENAASRHRVVVVTAPSGYGKTIAVSSWARTIGGPLAWLTLTRLDVQGEDVDAGVLASVVRATSADGKKRGASQLGPAPDAESSREVHRLLTTALSQVPEILTLVVDDLHAAEAAVATSVIPLLVEHEIPNLRLVLVGQGTPFHTARLILSGDLTTIRRDALAFTESEALAVLGSEIGPSAQVDVSEVVRTTRGWPAAVRLMLIEGAERPASGHRSSNAALLQDFFGEQVLDALDPPLVEFLLAATTCSRLDADLARTLTGRTDAGNILDECVRSGLFLERYDEDRHETVYRWHGVFVALCRSALGRREPGRRDALNQTAARELARRGFAAAAVRLALRGRAPDLAASIMRDQWLTVLLQSSGAQTAELITSLPEPWASDPELLLARACSLDVMGDRQGARLDYERASHVAAQLHSTHKVSAVRALAELMIADDWRTLSAAADQLRQALPRAPELSRSVRATALYILGRAEVRLRRDLTRTVEILETAVRECERAGLHDIATQAQTNLAFATAFAGDLDGALSLCDSVPALAPDVAYWHTYYDGGLEEFTRGFVDFWRGDSATAGRRFRATLTAAGGRGYSDVARVWLVLAAVQGNDRRALDDAEAGLNLVPERERYGVPWDVYRAVGTALLLEARGRKAEALDALVGTAFTPDTRGMAAHAAQLFVRLQELDRAHDVLAVLQGPQPSYVETAVLLTRALLSRSEGQDGHVHALLETALDLAATHGIVQPFAVAGAGLASLLSDHATRGTKHELMVASLLAMTTEVRVVEPLSRREREMLAYLQTPMTNVEIARAMFVSANTLKTHQRTLYRKLGVTSRREAVRRGPALDRGAARHAVGRP